MKSLITLVLHITYITVLFQFSCKPQQQAPSADTEETIVEQDSSAVSDTDAVFQPDSEETESNEGLVDNIRNLALDRDIRVAINRSEIFSSHFTGFCLYDPHTQQYLSEYNADKYFTPASNTKILTLYATLRSFDLLLPTALYRESEDTLYIRPVGDPTILHPEYEQQKLLQLIRSSPKPVAILWPDAGLDSYGEGWMWDDYNSRYMPELSWMPLYGNVATFQYERNSISAYPALFSDLIEINRNYTRRSNTVQRANGYNYFSAEIRYPNWSFD